MAAKQGQNILLFMSIRTRNILFISAMTGSLGGCEFALPGSGPPPPRRPTPSRSRPHLSEMSSDLDLGRSDGAAARAGRGAPSGAGVPSFPSRTTLAAACAPGPEARQLALDPASTVSRGM
jgi:hypothetical protein